MNVDPSDYLRVNECVRAGVCVCLCVRVIACACIKAQLLQQQPLFIHLFCCCINIIGSLDTANKPTNEASCIMILTIANVQYSKIDRNMATKEYLDAAKHVSDQ